MSQQIGTVWVRKQKSQQINRTRPLHNRRQISKEILNERFIQRYF